MSIQGSFELFRELSVFQEYLPEGTDPVHFRMLAVGLAMVLMMRFRPRGFVTRRQPTVFLKERKAWWLLPIIIVLLLVGVLVVFSQSR